MAETTGLLNRRTGHSVPRVRISSSPQPIDSQPAAWQLAVFVDRPRRKLAYVRGRAAKIATRAVRPGGCESKGCPDPRGRPRDAASAAPRNLVRLTEQDSLPAYKSDLYKITLAERLICVQVFPDWPIPARFRIDLSRKTRPEARPCVQARHVHRLLDPA